MRLAACALNCFAFLAVCAAGADNPLEFRLYDPAELTVSPKAFYGPTYSLCLGPVCQQSQYDPYNPAATLPTTQTLSDLLRSRVSPETWEAAQGTIIEERGGMLWIGQSPRVQQQIGSFLSNLAMLNRTQIAVKSMLLALDQDPQENILANAAFEKLIRELGPSRIVAAPRILCPASYRSYVKAGREFTYLADLEISGDLHDSVVRTGFEGVVLDVCPHLSADAETVTVELSYTLNAKAELTDKSNIGFHPHLAHPTEDVKVKPVVVAADIQVDTPALRQAVIRNQVRVPSGKWIVAGTMPNPDTAAKEKLLALYLSAETLGANQGIKLANGAAAAPFHGFKQMAPAVENAAGAVETRSYDVRDICTYFSDQPASYFSHEFMQVAVDGPFLQPPPPRKLQAADLAVMLKELFGARFQDPVNSVEEREGKLVIVQTPATHEAIAKSLTALRRFVAPQLTIRTRLIAARDIPAATFLDEADVDAVLRAEGSTLVASPRLTCLHRQRTHLSSGRALNYIHDLDVSGATYDPVVKTVFEGLAFEARPLMALDGAGVWVDLEVALKSDLVKSKRSFGAFSETGGAAAPQATPVPSNRTLLAQFELETVSFNSSSFQSHLFVPKGRWLLAAVFKTADPKLAAHTLLFITADTIAE